jgi:light-regulated signal transduction histidine kinase (bacteriophytochrome)
MSSSQQHPNEHDDLAFRNKDLVTTRFQHVLTEGGHSVTTGSDTGKLLRCEDEPIHIPGAVQNFGFLIALDHQQGLQARVVSENSQKIIGYTPHQLFGLQSFTSILSGEHLDNFLDHLDFVQNGADVASNGLEVFSLSVSSLTQDELKLWCAMHINDRHPHLVICEFEPEDDQSNTQMPEVTAQSAEDTHDSHPSEEDWLASTRSASKPLRLSRSARQRPNMSLAGIEVSSVISQAQEQLGAQATLQGLLDVLVGLVQDLTGFHRTMVYQFDHAWNGRVVAELLNPETSKDLYRGLNFPATDIPRQARDLYKINKVRLLYDRDQETARFFCRSAEDLASPLDLTYSYLRAMSPIHSQYLRNMGVRSSLSISITAFGELWGLIACHSYGSKGHRIPFPTRNICRIIGDTASRNVERISYNSRLQMRTLINTVPAKKNPSGYITASSEELLSLLNASFGCLVIRDETKMLGEAGGIEKSQEVIAILEYLRKKSATRITTSTKIEKDFTDLHFPSGFQTIAGLLLVPLSSRGQDFIVFFRRSQTEEVKWAGNPHQKQIEGTLTPRKSFKTWNETTVGSKEWTEEELETAAVLYLVYGKYIEIWRQKEAALQNSQITRVLLANSAHEVRTPLNAIINYLEIALEGDLDLETRENLTKSYSASKALIYVINDLLDLTAAVEGGELTESEPFDIRGVLLQVTGWFAKDAQRKQLSYEIKMYPDPWLHHEVIGDARRLRQAVSNIIANAIENTETGGVRVDVTLTILQAENVELEICVSDTGTGMNPQRVDALSHELAQVGSEDSGALDDTTETARKALIDNANVGEARTFGLGLAVAARIVYNMRGQLRMKSEEHRGSRFVLVFPFDLSERTSAPQESKPDSSTTVPESGKEPSNGLLFETSSPSNIEEETTLITFGSRRGSRKPVTDSSQALSTGGTDSGDASNAASKNNINSLLEAIQMPSLVEAWPPSSTDDSSVSGKKAVLDQEDATQTAESAEPEESSNDLLEESDTVSPRPGTVKIAGQGQPLRASRIPTGLPSSIVDTSSDAPSVTGEAEGAPNNIDQSLPTSSTVLGASQNVPDDLSRSKKPPPTGRMRVLVAEDDPVNSRIIDKRLSKLGHEVNGEECVYAYREAEGRFDIILMDIQVSPERSLTSLVWNYADSVLLDAHHGRPRIYQVNPVFRGLPRFRHQRARHCCFSLAGRERARLLHGRRIRWLDPEADSFRQAPAHYEWRR